MKISSLVKSYTIIGHSTRALPKEQDISQYVHILFKHLRRIFVRKQEAGSTWCCSSPTQTTKGKSMRSKVPISLYANSASENRIIGLQFKQIQDLLCAPKIGRVGINHICYINLQIPKRAH